MTMIRSSRRAAATAVCRRFARSLASGAKSCVRLQPRDVEQSPARSRRSSRASRSSSALRAVPLSSPTSGITNPSTGKLLLDLQRLAQLGRQFARSAPPSPAAACPACRCRSSGSPRRRSSARTASSDAMPAVVNAAVRNPSTTRKTVSCCGKRHLQIDLGELRLAVGAQVLIAEAARDLEILVEAGDHQDLLEDLRRLRQRVEARPRERGWEPGNRARPPASTAS